MPSITTFIEFIFLSAFIHLFPRVSSQYVNIFSDDMSTSAVNGWSTSNNAFFGYSSGNCPQQNNALCTYFKNIDSNTPSIEQSFDITEYSAIRVRFDLSNMDLESGDLCQIYYAYDSIANKQLLQSYAGGNNEGWDYPNQSFDLPLSESSTIIWIWFQGKATADDSCACVMGYDKCYVSNFYLDGVAGSAAPTKSSNPTISPTKQPSQPPTMNPTTPPTRNPTSSPTRVPSTFPTLTPSRAPTPKPTEPSLLSCGQQASGDYNDQILEFYVRLPYAGDLTFDASSSNFVIQSLTAVFGVTPVGADMDNDGILTLVDVISGDYAFAIRASNGVYGAFDVSISCGSDNPTPSPTVVPSHTPTKNPTRRPTVAPLTPGSPTRAPTDSDKPTLSPTTASSRNPTLKPSFLPVLKCGEQLSGDYSNDEALTFDTWMPYDGYLTFDASASTFAIRSLTAVFGSTPVGFDTDYDGILALQNIIAGVYTFTLIAEPGYGPHQRYDVTVSCVLLNPVPLPTNAPQFPMDDISSTLSEDDLNVNHSTPSMSPFTSAIIAFIALTCVCIVVGGAVYLRKKGNSQTDVNNHGSATHDNSSIRVHSMEMTDGIDMRDEIRAQTLLDWFTHVVGLPQYFDVFMQHGYGTFQMVQSIDNEELLRSIGIKKQGHVSVMMSEIRKLQNNNGPRGFPTNIATANGTDVVIYDTNNGPHTIPSIGSELFGTQDGTEGGLTTMGEGHGGVLCTPMKQFVVKREGSMDDVEGLHVKDPQKDVTQGGDDIEAVTSASGESNVSKCVDCFQVKDGRVYEADGQFYCHECWSCYQGTGI